MKIELIKTKENDGDWYKILVDGSFKDLVRISPNRESESLDKATALFNYWKETNGTGREIIQSVEL